MTLAGIVPQPRLPIRVLRDNDVDVPGWTQEARRPSTRSRAAVGFAKAEGRSVCDPIPALGGLSYNP